MKKKNIAIIIIILVIIGSIIFLRYLGVNKNKYAIVKTSVVTTGNIKSYLSTTATIKSKNSKDYYSLQGKVLTVSVKAGDSVKKGQVLMTFDTTDFTTPVLQAQIAYNNAVSAKNDALSTNDINKGKLVDYNYDAMINDYTNQLNDINTKINASQGSPNSTLITSRDTLMAQINQLKASKSQLAPISDEKLKQLDNSIANAKASLDAAKNNQAKSSNTITADFDGYITALNLVVGQTGTGSIVALTLQDLNSLKGSLNVGKYDISKLSVGEAAIFKNDNKNYNGKVSYIDPAAKVTVSATGNTASIGVDVDILDNPSGLKVGFDSDVDILLGEVQNAIKIPAEAIKSDKTGRDYVYIVEKNKAVETTVKLGLQSDTEAQVLDGVKNGDSVILNPGVTIQNGTLVK